ncbi:MAG: hypothetical protein HC938_15530 [Nitrospira sp.]|nr:hypothetical protein [Nitrospira sp.]
MAVQFAAEQEAEASGVTVEGYPMDLVSSQNPDTKWLIDWHPMVNAMLEDALQMAIGFEQIGRPGFISVLQWLRCVLPKQLVYLASS